VINKLRDKYLTVNTHHLVSKKRNSIEFRLLEGTKDASVAVPWVSLILNFVQTASSIAVPEDYRWLERDEVFKMFLTTEGRGWMERRTRQNRPKKSSRFWLVRDSAAEKYSDERVFFGRTSSFIESPGDT
jgi:hypothetical protein